MCSLVFAMAITQFEIVCVPNVVLLVALYRSFRRGEDNRVTVVSFIRITSKSYQPNWLKKQKTSHTIKEKCMREFKSVHGFS